MHYILRKKTIISIILCVVFAITFITSTGMTLAAWAISDESIKNISIGSVTGQIVESYEQGQIVHPGSLVNKIVQIKNIGTIDSIVRVKIDKAWGNSRTENGELIINSQLGTENIIINFDTDTWYFNDEDGYFYYKDVLSPGNITTPLFRNFKLAGENSQNYQGKTADIVVLMEMIQAGGNGVSFWNMTYEDLGITYTTNVTTTKVTSVEFLNPTKGFLFDEKFDLFANFKDLIPGESRSQTINVTNQWNKPTNIYLRADYIDQNQATPETLALIDKLLKEYATVIITEEDGSIIYSGPVWGNPNVDSDGPESMKYNYNLGTFKAHQTKKINVALSLSPEVDNQYKELLGQIKWIWSAEGNESEVPTPPDTSDADTSIYLLVMMVSGIAFCITLGYMEKSKKKEA